MPTIKRRHGNDGDEELRTKEKRKKKACESSSSSSTNMSKEARHGLGERSETLTSTTDATYTTPVKAWPSRRAQSLGPRHDVPPLKKRKSIFDRLYGSIELPPLLIAVMDTEEFQRLDKIQQLGGSSYVYPSAKHSRKEHSIGVAHLAGEMVRQLRKRGAAEITVDDELCVELAGLCHDMGHGPYSHMFETVFERVDHETMSQRLVRRCAKKVERFADYFEHPSQVEKHVNFVCQLIEGLEEEEPFPADIGRNNSKRYLFDIVSNSRSGVDVDKIDYLHRDAMATLGKSAPFDVKRLLSACRADTDHVRYEEKVAMDINSIFAVRADLHRQVYQHRVANVAELMISDVLKEADRSAFRIRGKRISEAAVEPELFVLLTDGILDVIQLSDAQGLEQAHDILARLHSRDFYRAVGPGKAIPTLPSCTQCGAETRLADKFCAACGLRTKNRKHALDKIGRRVPLGVNDGDDSWHNDLHGKCGIDKAKFVVKVSHVRRGWPCTVVDPYDGVDWATFDPLVNVKFWNPKLPPAEWRGSCKISPLFLPERAFERVVYCYYKPKIEGDPSLDEDFVKLCRAYDSIFNKFDEDQGRTNITSPSPHKSDKKRRRSTESHQVTRSNQLCDIRSIRDRQAPPPASVESPAYCKL